MIANKKISNFSDENYKDFFSWIFGRKIDKLEKEFDISRCNILEKPYIYYTPEIKAFFETRSYEKIRKNRSIHKWRFF